MKQMLMFILVLTMMLSGLTGCAEEAEARGGANLSYERIVEMTLYMRELAVGDYMDIKQVPEAMQTIAQGWADGITDTPRLAVQLDINDSSYIVETRAAFSQEPPVVLYEAESTAMVEVWQYLAYYAGNEAGLSESGYEDIMTVNSQLTAIMTYAEEGVEGNAMYLVLYENAAPMLYLVNAENGGVSIQGMFLPSAKLAKCQNYGQISLWLMMNGFSMTCREIKAE